MNLRAATKVNLIVVVGLLGLIAIAILVFFGGKSPQRAGEEFMQALAKKDVPKLVEMSDLPSASPPLDQQWSECVNEKAKDYVFMWAWEEGKSTPADDESVLRLHLIEFKGATQEDTDTYEFPLIKRDGKWKVDLKGLTRKFFPGLPR